MCSLSDSFSCQLNQTVELVLSIKRNPTKLNMTLFLSLIVYLPGVFFHALSSLSSGSQPEVASFLASVGMEARSGSRVSVKCIELLASETSLVKSFARQR